ncbi:LuxR family transcriptional regulator [Streptomyces sp. IB2014 016-6]|uniref:helix-turn-helix transcriptional regulator n=1 Tax=Streptomyces sp. IB2014 016-6 TaxID=2517818 RepID=UPI0011CB4B3C|nr:LuxR family transcriptional regulator [Streptomyces sp. IB2014 016-6]TXL87717.1 helix-turn-helix transcriptional regulator [Streptomyces sp. IB2014 016-6]
MLGSLGLSETVDAVYRLLLRQSGGTVAEVAKILDIEVTEVREALDVLADLTLIRRSWRDPSTLLPANPEAALQAILAERQAELARKQQEVEELRAAAARLASDYVLEYSYGRGRMFERLPSVEAVRMRMDELVAATKRETLAFAPGGPQTAENRAASRPLAESLLARSVVMKTIYLDSVRNDPGSMEHALWMAEKGGGTRTTPSLPMRLQILDRRYALVPIDPEDSSQGATLIEEPGVVAALCAFFEIVWESAVPVTELKPRRNGQVSPQEKELLRLLSQGLTDEAAARKLGVSLRTERRMITEISTRLEVNSRFQLGQRATEDGLLSS